MKKNTSTNHPKPAAHLRMIADCIGKGWIKRVGDSYEITPKGHAYTCALTASLPTTSTFEGTEP